MHGISEIWVVKRETVNTSLSYPLTCNFWHAAPFHPCRATVFCSSPPEQLCLSPSATPTSNRFVIVSRMRANPLASWLRNTNNLIQETTSSYKPSFQHWHSWMLGTYRCDRKEFSTCALIHEAILRDKQRIQKYSSFERALQCLNKRLISAFASRRKQVSTLKINLFLLLCEHFICCRRLVSTSPCNHVVFQPFFVSFFSHCLRQRYWAI